MHVCMGIDMDMDIDMWLFLYFGGLFLGLVYIVIGYVQGWYMK